MVTCGIFNTGSPKHEETSYYSMDSIFKFFRELDEIDEATKLAQSEEYTSEDQEEAPKEQLLDRTEKRESGEGDDSKKVQTHNLPELHTFKEDNATHLIESNKAVGNSEDKSTTHASHEQAISLDSEQVDDADSAKEEL